MAESEPVNPVEPTDNPTEERVIVGRENRTGSRADFISAIIFICIGMVTIVESLRMPIFESWGSYARPGFPPAFFGGLLIVFSLLVLVRSIREGGSRLALTGDKARAFLQAPTTIRFLVVLAMVAAFLYLMNVITFLYSSILFLFAMMLYFKAGTWWRSLIISVVVGFGLWYLFKKVFLVPLP